MDPRELDFSFDFIINSITNSGDVSDTSNDIDTRNEGDISNAFNTYILKDFMMFPEDIIIIILSFLNIQDLVTLDIAYSNRLNRPRLLDILEGISCNHVFNFDHIQCEKNWSRTDSALTWVGLRQISISSLVVKSHVHLTNDGLIGLAKHCTNLSSLNISKCKLITDDGIEEITRKCSSLTYLEINKCKFISSTSIKFMAKNTTGLVYLSACYCNIDSSTVAVIGMHCKSLSTLLLEGCHLVSDYGLFALQKHPKLTCLNIARCDVSFGGIRSLAAHLTILTTLYISGRREELTEFGHYVDQINWIRQQCLRVEGSIHDRDSDSDGDSDSLHTLIVILLYSIYTKLLYFYSNAILETWSVTNY